MRVPILLARLGLACAISIAGLATRLTAAAPTITSATSVDLSYDPQSPADSQFAYRVIATGAPTAFDATGLPPNALIDPATGWINGSRNVPGVYDATIRAANADGTGTATVRFTIHPAAIGVTSTRGVFHAGQSFAVTVYFNAPVFVNGAPHLTVAIGPAGTPVLKNATYASGSGSKQLVFQYLVQGGDADPDGVQLPSDGLEISEIVDANSVTVAGGLPVRYFDSGITITADTTSASSAAGQPAAAATSSRMVNVSSRMQVVDGDSSRSLIVGFVVSGAASKKTLLRAVGPALGNFGVPDPLQDPGLRLYASSGALAASNDDWSGTETSATAAAVGAFVLTDGARDAALVATLQPGAYTLVVVANGGSGTALAEVYDAGDGSAADSSEIINLSTRGRVDAGGGALIAGFAVHGNAARRVLVRGIGPALAAFGVTGTLTDPTLQIFQDGRLVAQNDDWSGAAADVSAASTVTGAFALAPGSKDAAVVLTLAPGAYSAVVNGANGTSGAALVEVYAVPPSNP